MGKISVNAKFEELKIIVIREAFAWEFVLQSRGSWEETVQLEPSSLLME